jgi:hypothetical protein
VSKRKKNHDERRTYIFDPLHQGLFIILLQQRDGDPHLLRLCVGFRDLDLGRKAQSLKICKVKTVRRNGRLQTSQEDGVHLGFVVFFGWRDVSRSKLLELTTSTWVKRLKGQVGRRVTGASDTDAHRGISRGSL